MNPICPYCKADSLLTTGAELYPHLPKLASKHFYRCAPCDAHVGCHDGTTTPLGRLADAELRKFKTMTHREFDPLWREHGYTRSAAYRSLAKSLGIAAKDCHIGMFDVEMCKRAIIASKALRAQVKSYQPE